MQTGLLGVWSRGELSVLLAKCVQLPVTPCLWLCGFRGAVSLLQWNQTRSLLPELLLFSYRIAYHVRSAGSLVQVLASAVTALGVAQ